MPWNNLPPFISAAGAPVKVGVMKVAGGSPKVSLTINAETYDALGKPERCNVFSGDGDEAGSLLVQFDKDGTHHLGQLSRGGARLLLPLLASASKEKQKPVAVHFERDETEEGVHLLTVRLPW